MKLSLRLGVFAFLAAVVAAPLARAQNNTFALAPFISGYSTSASGNNFSSTKESGEPNHAGRSSTSSVWYKWVAPGSGTVTLDTMGSNFDTLLAVYTGVSVSSLTAVASNDDIGGSDLDSRVTFQAVGGTTYAIAIDGYNSLQGNFVLHLAMVGTNDTFDLAQVVSGFSTTLSGNNTAASFESGEPVHAGTGSRKSLWFRWVAPVSGFATLNAISPTFNIVYGVYVGTQVNALSQVASASAYSMQFFATGGVSYAIAVDGYQGAAGSFNVALTLTSAPPPFNDNFANASVVSGVNTGGSSSNMTATRETGEPDLAGVSGNKSVWWRWSAPSNGMAYFSFGGSFPMTLAVFTGNTLASLDLAGSSTSGNLAIPVQGGTTYWILMDSLGASGGSCGFNLSLQSVANDNFANAIAITASSTTLSSSNVNATKEPGEPNHGGGTGGHSLWWKFTAPAEGRITLSYAGGVPNPLLAGYLGTSVSGLSLIGQGLGSAAFNVLGGHTYYIAVDTTGAGGGFAINFSYQQWPTATMAITGGSHAGDTATIDLTVGDPDGNFAFANLLVATPGGVFTILSNNSLGAQAYDISGATTTTAGSFTRQFVYGGPGTYYFQLYAFDSAGNGITVGPIGVSVVAGFQGNPIADGDADGIGDLAEYFLGLDAGVANATGLPVGTVENGEFVFRFNRAIAASDVSYSVTTSTDLVTWLPSAVGPQLESTNAGLEAYVVRLPIAGPRLFARLELTGASTTVHTTPLGLMRFPLGSGVTTAFGIPLTDTSVPSAGLRAGKIEAFSPTTLTHSGGGWSGNLANPAAPWVVRLTSGPSAGKLLDIAANTSTTLTVSGTNLTSLGLTAGLDTFELVPMDTLDSLLGGGVLQGGATAAVADQVQVRSGTSWLAYYFDTTLGFWRRTIGPATNSNSVRIRPESGVQVLRRGAPLTLTFVGRVPVLPFRPAIGNAATTVVHAGFPTDTTLVGLGIASSIPGWRTGISVTTADQIALFNGTSWIVYFHNGSFWQPATGAAVNSDTQPIPAGSLLTFQRPGTTPGTTDLNRPLPYLP